MTEMTDIPQDSELADWYREQQCRYQARQDALEYDVPAVTFLSGGVSMHIEAYGFTYDD